MNRILYKIAPKMGGLKTQFSSSRDKVSQLQKMIPFYKSPQSSIMGTFNVRNYTKTESPHKQKKQQKIKLRKMEQGSATKSQYVQADTENVFQPCHERIFKLSNGYYMVYYNRPEKWRLPWIYMKFIVPIAVLYYLIKKNPFYKTYPAMLPFMCISFILIITGMVKYSRITNQMVHQILMDPSGTELTFIYQNQFFRRLRSDQAERTLMISQLVDPPQGDDYIPLSGDLFPKHYPISKSDPTFDFGYFFRKYFITQRQYFSIPKNPQYCNYEVLVPAFSQQIIDLSKAEIVQLDLEGQNKEALEKFLIQQNSFSDNQMEIISDKFQQLQNLERELTWDKHQFKVDSIYLKMRQNNTFDELNSSVKK